MSWGIAETASEIEKIKSESADYLNGLNSCGVIDWNTYNYAFDFYADLLMKAYKQGEKDAQQEPCEDAVSRQDALDVLDGLQIAHEQGEYGCYAEYRKHMCELPSVTPKRKTGKWLPVEHKSILNDGTTFMFHKCDQCERVTAQNYDFCPNCGADMRGE